MSTFDLDSFLNAPNEGTVESTFTPIPAGEYLAQINEDDKAVTIRVGTSAKGNVWARLDAVTRIADPTGALKATHGDNPTFTIRQMLDLADGSTEEQPRLDTGTNRNLRLGKLLDATGINKPGWRWSELKGKSLKIKLGVGNRADDPSLKENTIEAFSVAAS